MDQRIREELKDRILSVPEQVLWGLVTGWLRSPENDLLARGLILNEPMPSYETAAFQAQQAAEKALKAFLTRHQVEFTKTHDLGELLRLAEPAAPGITSKLTDADKLNRHAVETRYPTGAPSVSRQEAARDLAIATDVVTHVRALLQSYLDAGRPGG